MTSSATMRAANLIEAAELAGGFDAFLGLVDRAGLAAMLTGPKRYTIFAPTDDAFAQASKRMRDNLVPGRPADLIHSIVSAHLVAGQMLSHRMQGRRIRGKSVEGSELLIDGDEAISVNGALIVRPDIMGENGVLHGIDKVLWPKGAHLEVA